MAVFHSIYKFTHLYALFLRIIYVFQFKINFNFCFCFNFQMRLHWSQIVNTVNSVILSKTPAATTTWTATKQIHLQDILERL